MSTAPWDIYAKQLFPMRHGHPLWKPEPNKGYELVIGEVGYLYDGGFYRLFNATLPQDHPSQEYGYPDHYTPFNLRTYLVNQTQAFVESHLCSASVKALSLTGDVTTAATPVGAGMRFKCSTETGAFVCLDQPADREMMHPSKSFAHYMKTNIDEWYELAGKNDLYCQRDDIMFLSGMTRANDWALGAFTQHGNLGEVYVQAQFGPLLQSSLAFSLRTEGTAQAATRSKPKTREGSAIGVPPPSQLDMGAGGSFGTDIRGPSFDASRSTHSLDVKKDQCMFIHFWKVKKRFWLGRQAYSAAAGPDQRDPDRTGDGNDVDVDGHEEDVVVNDQGEDIHDTASSKPYNAVDILLDYIMDYVFEDGSQVEVAIASDTHLYDLFDGILPLDIRTALEELKPPVMYLDDTREIACLACVEWAEDLNDEDVAMYEEPVRDTGKRREEFVGPPEDNDNDANCDPEEAPPDQPRTEGENKDRPAVHDDEPQQPMVLQDHTGGVTCVAFSPDGRYIASGSEDTSIILRDGMSGDVIDKLPDHSDAVWTIAFSPDSARLASGAADGAALIWDVETRSVIAVLDNHNGVVQTIAYSPDGSKIVTASVDFTVCVWDATTGFQLHKLEDHHAVVMDALFSPNGRFIASCGADYTAKVWDADTGTLLHNLKAHSGVVWSLSFSPDSRRLVTGSDDTTSRIWNAETGEELVTLREHHGPVWSVAFSPDGKAVMSASNDATIKVCDSFSGEQLHAFDRHDTLVNSVVFSPKGSYIASSTGNNAVMVWDSKTGKSLPPMTGHLDKVTGLQFSPEGDRLVSCSDDGTVRVWKLPEPVVGEE